jgi:S-adenosylmethionine:tRNA-ribosyltransferase-isomerase (queuine synthetase)
MNLWGSIIIFVLVSDFDFLLPLELIAQHPPAERAASRMLHLQGELPTWWFSTTRECFRHGCLGGAAESGRSG